ncbi:hypothetical protein [Dictyobacter alpinus]|uniref:hypothetical protein n=1 Tax=Dictyobacter alpinus TaxID=2014873 RepID=UPI000F8415EA|nr:hypothetical protein [Dictyobacter alpinus]
MPGQDPGRTGEIEQRSALARADIAREKITQTFGGLTEQSLDLLVDLSLRDADLARLVGQALARERDHALANHARAEQERIALVVQARKRAAELGYPAIDALDLDEGERHWRQYLANPKHDLILLLTEIAKLVEKIRTLKVKLSLRVENNSKYVRGKGRVRDELSGIF